jgi:hypothetical protein
MYALLVLAGVMRVVPVLGEPGTEAPQITIEAKIIRTLADNLKDGVMTESQKADGGKACQIKCLGDEQFKDPGKVEKIVFPKVTTLSGIEAEQDVEYPVYYIEDAMKDKNGDINCRIKKDKRGMVFKVLPTISEEDPDSIHLECQFQLDTLLERISDVPAIADVKALEPLWIPVIDTINVNSDVIIKDGETVIMGGLEKAAKMKEGEKKPADTAAFIFLTAKKEKAR